MSELDNLRQEALNRHRAVSKKISRTRRVNGAEIEGTRFDPRREPEKFKTYNRAQLEGTLRAYDTFMSRSVQFYGDSEGRPLVGKQWKIYKNLERTFNRNARNQFATISELEIPGRNMTASEYVASTRSDFPRAADPAVNSPYTEYNRAPANIASTKGLKHLIKTLKKNIQPNYFDKLQKEARRQADRMFEIVGQEGLQKRVQGLNSKQFNALWITKFAAALSGKYELLKDSTAKSKKQWYDVVSDNEFDDMVELIDWAEKIK
jgi:hypothetical protein